MSTAKRAIEEELGLDRMHCPYGDPTCPCQDGDACHYEGPDPINVRPEYVRRAIKQAIEAVRDETLRRIRDLKL